MTAPITVIVPSIPARAALLLELEHSIEAQTVPPRDVLVRVEEPPAAGAFCPPVIGACRNRLLELVTTPWLANTDDDDLYLPRHFETIAPVLEEGTAELVYTYGMGINCPNVDVLGWTQAELVARLEAGNMIPGTVALSTEAVRAVGGWSEDGFDMATRRYSSTGAGWDDWDLWIRLARAGARFRCVPVITWDHRHGDWPACTH